MAAEHGRILKYEHVASAVDAPFWQIFTKQKLEVHKLDDKPIPVEAYYTPGHSVSVSKGRSAFTNNPETNDSSKDRVALQARICLNAYAFAENQRWVVQFECCIYFYILTNATSFDIQCRRRLTGCAWHNDQFQHDTRISESRSSGNTR